jgi:predicted SAM-dependent methyltransferase
LDTFRNVHRMLDLGGRFLFDVPDYPVWCRYYLDMLEGREIPVTEEHVRKTLFGWQRWPGDEHKWGWDVQTLHDALLDCGFLDVSWSVEPFRLRTYRRRFDRPEDAHLYVTAHR